MAPNDRRPTRKPSSAAPKKRTASAGGKKTYGKNARGNDKFKRTSKNTDDRNPTRSGIDYPSRKFRAPSEEPAEPKPRPSLRKKTSQAVPKKAAPAKKGRPAKGKTTKSGKPARKTHAPKKGGTSSHRRRRVKTTEASEELAKLAGRNAKKAQEQLARAAEAFQAGRERDAMRLLRPLRDAYPDASAVRELLGLAHYRLGQYQAAAKELDAFVQLTDSVEQHPVLMDCNRALGKYKRVDELWDELALASPSSALVTEGRIVAAGAKADRGRLREAISMLDRRAAKPSRIQEHHLRLWYALADLFERAGDIPHARELFLRVRKADASFADVAERLAVLG